MERITRWLGTALIACNAVACTTVPMPDPTPPSLMTRQIVAERASAVVVTDRKNLKESSGGRFKVTIAPGDSDGGSATPISPDGYFLTADHVLARMAGRNVYVIHNSGGRLVTTPARVVWRSEPADLALLHIPVKTPYFYRWTRPGQWLPEGTSVIHGGISTGFRSSPGKLTTSLAPEGMMTRNRSFKIDIPLQPGDSGGPVVDAYGALVGINSAVEFLVPLETAFFVDSEGNRPNTAMIESLIGKDRARNSTRTAHVAW